MASEIRFKAIFDEYHPKILRYLVRIVGPNDAEDLTQEVFERVSRGLSGFQGQSSLSTWIYRIATNAAIDRTRSAPYRYEREHRPLEDEMAHDASGVPVTPTPTVTDRLVIRKQMSDCVNEFIDNLPPDYRTVIVLSEMEGMANKEIAEILNISLDTAKVRLHRARARLREALKQGCDFYHDDENTLVCDRKQVQILPKLPK